MQAICNLLEYKLNTPTHSSYSMVQTRVKVMKTAIHEMLGVHYSKLSQVLLKVSSDDVYR
jgi:hypothetical protein